MSVEPAPHAFELSVLAPDFLRLSLPLPFPPGAVNAWLLRNPDGWTLIDCGVDTAVARGWFERALADPALEGRPVTQILVTHFHPDHLGLAGWLCARTGADLAMTRTEWLQARVLLHEEPQEATRHLIAHHRRCGAPEDFLAFVARRGTIYPKWVGALPPAYLRVREGETLALAGTSWRVMIGEGHAPEMICLYSAERGVLIAADQILGRITPHIGSQASDPRADPLGAFLSSLAQFEALPEDTLVLPSHGEPFPGPGARVAALKAHHAARLERLLDFCATPRTVMDTTQVLFRSLALEQTGFALSEALAHLRHLMARGEIMQDAMPGPAVARAVDTRFPGGAEAGDLHWLFSRA